jgi:4'-phosphopantetheinyl transferase
MPLFKVIESSQAKLFVWHITETKEELLHLMQPRLELALEGYNDEQRNHLSHNSHFLSTRILLFLYAGLTSPVLKNLYGKPETKAKYISITHSNDYAAVIASDSMQVAIDLEKIDSRILRVAHKFMHDDENFFSRDEEVICTTLIWSAKETLYKLYSERQVFFKEELRVHPFIINKEGEFSGAVLKGKPLLNLNIHYQTFDQYVLTWLVN